MTSSPLHSSGTTPPLKGLPRLRLSDLATAFAEAARSYEEFLDGIVDYSVGDDIAFSSAAAIAQFHEICTAMRAKLEDMQSLFNNQMAEAEKACRTRIEISAGNGEIVTTSEFLIDPTRSLRGRTNSATVWDVTQRLRDYIGNWNCAKREELSQELRDAFHEWFPPVARLGAQSSESHEIARYIFRERVSACRVKGKATSGSAAARRFRVEGFLTIAWKHLRDPSFFKDKRPADHDLRGFQPEIYFEVDPDSQWWTLNNVDVPNGLNSVENLHYNIDGCMLLTPSFVRKEVTDSEIILAIQPKPNGPSTNWHFEFSFGSEQTAEEAYTKTCALSRLSRRGDSANEKPLSWYQMSLLFEAEAWTDLAWIFVYGDLLTVMNNLTVGKVTQLLEKLGAKCESERFCVNLRVG